MKPWSEYNEKKLPVSRTGSFFPYDWSISARPATISFSWLRISAVEVVTRKNIEADAFSASAFKACPPDIKPILTVVFPELLVLTLALSQRNIHYHVPLTHTFLPYISALCIKLSALTSKRRRENIYQGWTRKPSRDNIGNIFEKRLINQNILCGTSTKLDNLYLLSILC